MKKNIPFPLLLLLLATIFGAAAVQAAAQPQGTALSSGTAAGGVSSLPGLSADRQASAGQPRPPDAGAAPAADPLSDGPWPVAEVVVKGSVNLKPKAVIRAGKARKGRLYLKQFVSEDIESIMGLDGVDKVSVDIDRLPGTPVPPKLAEAAGSTVPVRVTYVIKEKPMIKKITVYGAKGLSKTRVKDEMGLKERDFFDDLKMREDLIKIDDLYHGKGYIDAKADYSVRYDTAASLCYLDVTVNEGPKAKVDAVLINGAKGFPVKKLIKKMKNRPKRIYSPQDLDSDLKALGTFYKDNGYADFKLLSSSVTFNAERSGVTITIAVDEGQRQKFGGTYFAGNTLYLSSQLMPAVEYRRGKLFNKELFDDTIRNIQEKYANKGYLKAVVEPDLVFDKKTGQTDITFNITENDQIFVGHIDVEGNKATKTYVLRREIVQKEGAYFDAAKIRRSQERIFNLGFIDDVNPVINPTSDPDKVDLVFDVTEGKPGMLTAGAGVSSVDGLVGTLSLSHMNLFGRAQRLSLSWNFGKRVQDYNVDWTTPWIGDHPTSLGVNLYHTRHYMPYQTTLSAYSQRSTGGKITLGPRFDNDKYHLTTAYTYEQVRIAEVDPLYTGVLQEGTSVTSSIYVEFARDTRDNIWDPTRGTKTSLGIEYAGGPLLGDVDYYKPTFSYSYNMKLFDLGDYPFVMSFANRLGMVGHYGPTKSVPVYERYFLGGADTIRGYANNGQIGPLNGGNAYDVANLEFRLPLAREKRRTIVEWAFFLDAGNSWESFNDVSGRFGTGVTNLKAGAGFGIRFTTPAFPIRLDWGYGFNHKPGEQKSDIYFTLGNLF